MKRLMLGVLGIVLFVSGCASVPKMKEPMETQQTFNVPYDTMWPSLVTLVTEGGNFVTVSDKASGLLTYTMSMKDKKVEDYVLESKPFMTMYNYQNGEAQVNMRVKAVDGNTTNIKINSRISAQLPGAYNIPVHYKLSSNGKLEKEVFSMIATQSGTKEYKFME